MSVSKPPPGYIGMADAVARTETSMQTIRRAIISGDLKAFQRTTWAPLYFKPEDLDAWAAPKPVVPSERAS